MKLTVQERDKSMYQQIWAQRAHICQDCGEPLGSKAYTWMFHHILEKRTKTKMPHNDFSQYRWCKWNIWLLCRICHDAYEDNPDNRPVIHEHRSWLISVIFLPTFMYDEDHYWFDGEQEDFEDVKSLFPNMLINYE